MLGAIATMRGADGTEMLALARLGCDVPEDIDDAPLFRAVRSLIDIHDQFLTEAPTDRRRIAFLILAASVARTPDIPVPDLDD
jgi:hypothetical protein